MKRVLIVGSFNTWVSAIEASYARAFQDVGYDVQLFDIGQVMARYYRFGPFGKLLNQLVPIEPWVNKGGRDLVLKVAHYRPDIVMTFGNYPIRVGTLAQIRSTYNPKLVHVWPDTLQNWSTHLSSCLPLFDLVATYSDVTVKTFEVMGAPSAQWVPLAGDPLLLSPVPMTSQERQQYTADVSFVGGWRPEREAALSCLGDFQLKVWGPDWGRRSRGNPVIMRAWQGRGAYGDEFAKIIAYSKINLNIIDETNYPAANMRFFEIPTAGGFQLTSSCPEMTDEFQEGKHQVMYHSLDDLPTLVRSLLSDEEGRQAMALAAHALIMERHTYRHRTCQILEAIGL